MATLILTIAFIAELAFAAYCIITRSSQRRVRNFERIGALALFILLTLLSVIQWGFRWYLLALLLLIWAILGIVALIRRKADIKGYGAWRIVGKAVGTLLLLCLVLLPAFIFPQHTQPRVTGSHPVATASYTYTDPNRIETFTNTGAHREVNVECWYPSDGGGKYPLVLFSHGILGVKTSNTSTFMDLASNGYVVCSIDHPYQSMFTIDATRHMTRIDPAFLQSYMDVMGGKYVEPQETRLQQGWMSLRVADINFVLDTLLAKAAQAGSGAMYQMIDPGKIGLMGHSLGGESAAQVARERSDIGAVVNLDADLAGEYTDYVNGKWVLNAAPYPAPILNVFSDTLWRLLDAVPDANTAIAVKHLDATDPTAYEVHLTGTNHMSFTDLSVISPFLVSLINASVPAAGGQAVAPLTTLNAMNGLILNFFNATLKGQGTFSTTGTE